MPSALRFGSAAVRKHRAAAGIHQPLDHGVGVFGRVIGLRCIRPGRDALADFTQAGDELSDVAVFRVVGNAPEVPDVLAPVCGIGDPPRGPDVLDDGPVRLLRPRAGKQAVRDDASLQGLVLVMMGRDEAGHDDRARAVDHFGVAGGDVGGDLRDRLSVYDDIGLLEVADLRVEGEHDAAAQQDPAPGAIADEILSRTRSGRSVSGDLRLAARCGCERRRAGAGSQERAARERRR